MKNSSKSIFCLIMFAISIQTLTVRSKYDYSSNKDESRCNLHSRYNCIWTKTTVDSNYFFKFNSNSGTLVPISFRSFTFETKPQDSIIIKYEKRSLLYRENLKIVRLTRMKKNVMSIRKVTSFIGKEILRASNLKNQF